MCGLRRSAKKIRKAMKTLSAILAIILSSQLCPGQTTYYRADGGVTVVEQRSTLNGNQKTEVRRYKDQDQYVQGEFATEIFLAQFALVIISEASPYVTQTWSDFKVGLKGDFKGSFKDMLIVKFAGDKRRWFPLVTKVQDGSIASIAGVKPGDFIVFYNESHLGWATKANNPLGFKMDRAKEDGRRLCSMVICRDGQFYRTEIPAGLKIGVSLTEGPLPWSVQDQLK